MLIWLILIISPFLFGAACARAFTKQKALTLAISTPWVIFLVFNLYSEKYGSDREIMQGTWLFFQITGGTMVSVIGYLGSWFVARVSGYRSNSPANTDAPRPSP